MDQPTRTRVRTLFAVTLALFALQMPVIYFLQREPYPALTMPSFAGHPDPNGMISAKSGTAEVEFSDGSVEEIDLKQLLPSTKVRTGHVLRAFENEAFLAQPETVEWLKSRINAIFPAKHALRADIIWREAHYHVYDQGLEPKLFTPSSMVHVDFDGAK